ncbi:MAG: aldolase/citrate lyase family protein, partial [Actinomycetota bacterium]
MRMIQAAGYDFVMIDMQHSSLSNVTVADMCEMARGVGLVPIVRPVSHAPEIGGRVLDMGAAGLMHFDVSSRQQVDEFLRWMRCTPQGTRTVSRGALSDYG